MTAIIRTIALTALVVSLSACQSSGLRRAQAGQTDAALPPPPACSAVNGAETPKLVLPATETPQLASASEASGLDIAQVHTVNRSLADAGAWQTREDGWAVLALDIGSPRARSLAVRINALQPLASTQAWLCGSEAGERAGPFRAAPNGQLWTPDFAGARLRLEVWVPSGERERFGGVLADVYGGYR